MILERLKEYIDYKGITIAQFERNIGMSNASFGKSLKNGGAIGSDKLENILLVYTDINCEWLLTGVGEMIKSSNSINTQYRLPIEQNNSQVVLLKDIIKEKDREIKELSKQIGRLEAQNDFISRSSSSPYGYHIASEPTPIVKKNKK